ncbi:LysR family transcriptional regulator [Dongia soli]|uniref:LysR family transcriptional regulator n=1 Tax=Dongia soli TaxID=600628 RepID=A0ABU5E8M8_9PROT|nr:LysR family transcriptional regulator [Dongia soli]MDY0882715.1 LysR family transcriptional regulator [Dongia soli]
MIDRLTLDQLRILIAIAETGSFSAAARRLGRVQSAISQSVQSLEATLGLELFDRSGKIPILSEAGRAILTDARGLVHGADLLRARAESIANDIEPELALAVDPVFPTHILMESLSALDRAFPQLPVLLFTDGLGGPEQRLRDGVARLAVYSLLVTGATDLQAEPLTDIPFVPVVATTHPLSKRPTPISRIELAEVTQLVLTDSTPLTQTLRGNLIGRRLWRFADLQTRLDYLLAGFGWCNMPLHLVEKHLDSGRLIRLRLIEDTSFLAPLYIVHDRTRPPGRAGKWLIDDLRSRLARS